MSPGAIVASLGMETVTSFLAAAIPRDQLGAVLTDYFALEQAHIFRRRLVVRAGLLALLAVILGQVVPGFSYLSRWAMPAPFLLAPAWAWLTELRLEYRLARRLESCRADSRVGTLSDARPEDVPR